MPFELKDKRSSEWKPIRRAPQWCVLIHECLNNCDDLPDNQIAFSFVIREQSANSSYCPVEIILALWVIVAWLLANCLCRYSAKCKVFKKYETGTFLLWIILNRYCPCLRLKQACFLCTFEKTQGQNNSMFWPLAENSRIFSPKTQSYEAQSKTWCYRILALKL